MIEGKEGVLAFYNSVGEAVLWHSDDRLSVADWGSATKSPSTSSPRGATSSHRLRRRRGGRPLPRVEPAGLHLAVRRPGAAGRRAPLRGQDQPADRGGDPAEAITPARVREIHREQLAKLEAERGEGFWVLETVAASA